MELVFEVRLNGQKKVKTLRATKVETIIRQYKTYAEGRGYGECVYNENSFGNSCWVNAKTGDALFLVSVV